MKKLFAISAAASLAFCLLAASRPDATLVVTYDSNDAAMRSTAWSIPQTR